MRIEPDDLLYSAAQPFVLQGAMQQSLTVGLGVDLATGRVLPAARALGAAMAALAPGDCLDMGLPKREAEWLLAGEAQTPGGRPLRSLLAEIAVGDARRRFLVTAEGGKGEFTAVPLTWQETFGAPDSPENPLGRGLEADPASGKIRPPRVVGADDAYGRPACPGPMGAWPARMGEMGSYDKNWLQTRCPDLPDDCDLRFINLAQPAQRLPRGLQGDETLSLQGLNRDFPAISARLPGKSVHVFVLRRGAGKEEELRLPYDTLWLFPNQRLALLLGHLFLPAADGRASDIERVRLEMRPPEAEAAAAPPPKVEAAAPPEAAALAPEVAAVAPEAAALAPEIAKAAAMSAASVAASAAAAQKSARGSAQEPGQDGKAAAAVAAEKGKVGKVENNAPPAAANAAAGFSSLRADALRDLEASTGEINAGLAEAGLPPLSPEQIAATRAEIVRQTAAMEKLQQQIEATPAPELHDVLRRAGVPEQTIAGVDAVMAMEPPDPANYSDAASWNAAVAKYQADFERSLPLSDEVRQMQRTILQAQGPGGEQVLARITGPEPKLEEVLVKAGLSPDKAALLTRELEQEPSFQSLAEMKTYMAGLEQKMDFRPGSMTSVVDKVEKAAAEAGISLEPPPSPVANAAAAVQIQAAAPGRTGDGAKQAGNALSAASAASSAADKMSVLTKAADGTAGAAVAGEVAGAVAANEAPGAVKAVAAVPPPAGGALAGLDFSRQDLAGRDFSGQRLDGAIFTDAKLAGANFSGASLRGADFDRADCAGAVFDGATLNEVSFAETRLSEASLKGASAQNARFIAADLRAAKASGLNARAAEFDGANLSGGQFAGANFSQAGFRKAKAAKADMAQANFADAAFYQSDFAAASFRGAGMQRALVHGVSLAGGNFSGADLSGATILGGSDLSRADFSGAALKDADWREVRAGETSFAGSLAEGGRFAACDFTACDWRAARASGADFSHARLAGADFTGANLMGASLREAGAAGARFTGANLYAADLYRVPLENANLAGALTGNTLVAARKT